MVLSRKRTSALLVLLIGLGGLLPLALYWLTIGRAPALSVAQAAARLSEPNANALLVDVRSEEDFQTAHIEGAVNWPLSGIMSLSSVHDMPAPLRDKTLLLICDGGIESAAAALKLSGLGFVNALDVSGGLQSWIADAAYAGSTGSFQLRRASGQLAPIPFRSSPAGEQVAATFGGFMLKPLYMLIALGLVIVLWRSAAPDLTALRWGLVLFLAGESVCWVNFPIFHKESPFLEYLHSYGMVLCIGFLTFAFVHGLDRRVLGYGEAKARCALLGLCRGCARYKPVPCGLTRLFTLTLAALAVVSLMPLNTDVVPTSYNTRVFGLPLNYSHPILNQLYEIRWVPAAGAVMLLLSLGVLRSGRPGSWPVAQLLFAGGIGHLSFALMRLALLAFYRHNLAWFAFWEEATEFILIVGVGVVLWTLRGGLALDLDWLALGSYKPARSQP